MQNTIKRIFYIYTEASLAVFMLMCALVEMLCGIYFALNGSAALMVYLTFGATLVFLSVSLSNAYYVYRKETN